MNYYELKEIRKKLDAQKLKVAALRDKAVSLPERGGASDRTSVDDVIAAEERLGELYAHLTDGIKSIPDEYIRALIHCKLVKHWSWTRIAQEVGGYNNGDNIRKICVRYRWQVSDGCRKQST